MVFVTSEIWREIFVKGNEEIRVQAREFTLGSHASR